MIIQRLSSAIRQQLEPFQDTMHDLAAALTPFIQWRVVGEYDEESTGAPGLTNSCEIDFESIGADAQAMSHLAQLYRTQVSIGNFRRLEIQADQTALDLIAGQIR